MGVPSPYLAVFSGRFFDPFKYIFQTFFYNSRSCLNFEKATVFLVVKYCTIRGYNNSVMLSLYGNSCVLDFDFFLGPNAPPSNVRAKNLSSTSIFVQWSNVPAADQNGVILSYTVDYKALPNGSPQTEVVNAPTTHVTLTCLNEYTNYSITVFASTMKGDGNTSVPIIVITDEDSKFLSKF